MPLLCLCSAVLRTGREEESNPISDEPGERYTVLFDFTAEADIGEDDEPQLSLKMGSLVLVTDTSDEQWFTGSLINEDGSVGDKQGVFPANYVARLEEPRASSPDIDADDLPVNLSDDDEDDEPEWKKQRIEKLRKAVQREHHAAIGIVSTSIYCARRSPKLTC